MQLGFMEELVRYFCSFLVPGFSLRSAPPELYSSVADPSEGVLEKQTHLYEDLRDQN